MWYTMRKALMALVLTAATAGTALAAPGPFQGPKNKPVAVKVVKKTPAKVVVVEAAPEGRWDGRDDDRFDRRDDRIGRRFLRDLPRRAEVVRLRGQRLFVVDGHFYQKARGGYLLTDAPFGARVQAKALPRTGERLVVGQRTYRRVGGAWFLKDRQQFILVARPV